MVETDWKAGTPGFLNLYINGTYQNTLSANNSNNTIIYPALGVPNSPRQQSLVHFILMIGKLMMMVVV